MKMRTRLLGIVALAAVSLAAMSIAVTHCHRAKPEPTAALSGFALIPAGEFTMGDSLDGDKNAPPHPVYVSAFYMGQKEVTKPEWDSVRIWAASHGYTDLAEGAGKAAKHSVKPGSWWDVVTGKAVAGKAAEYPVTNVSWWDVIKWCNARSEKEGLTPCYTVSGSVIKTDPNAFRPSTRYTYPTVNWAANGYRLPTEAEWEKAARGGLSGKRFPWGDTISHTQANFENDGGEFYQTGTTGDHPTYGTGDMSDTSPVGSFPANGYGLYDMSGNVWEWCWDWYDVYTSGAQTDPRGVASGLNRVLRGGCYVGNANDCRAALRGGRYPDEIGTWGLIGFRVARSSVPK